MAKRKSDTLVSNPKKKQSTDKRRLFNHIVIVIMAGILLVGVSCFFMLSNVVGKVLLEDPTKEIKNTEPSVVYADDGETVVHTYGGVSRENVTYDQIPQSVIDAFLSIEDSRYYSHNGFDLPRFISSAITNIKSGSFAQGGSTLTMQLIDNSSMKPKEEKKKAEGKSYNKLEQVELKIQEIYLSMKLEKEWTKEEIVTKYLNEINFGDNASGIQKAAQYYFGKDISEVNLSESAFLAGVINAPNYYNPYYGNEYYERAIKRRDQTLSMMLYHGFITQSEYDMAAGTQLAFQMNDTSIGSDSDKHRDYWYQLQQEIINLTGKDPATTQMTIYSAMNLEAQEKAEALAKGDGVTLPENKYYQLGATMINNTNGEIVAVIGGRSDIASDGTYKTRQNEPKQPGSTAKPLLDYAPAFDDLGWCTARVMSDKEAYKLDSNISIYNADGKFNGDVTLERALAQSLNTIALQTMEAYLEEEGDSSMIQYLKDMGLSDDTAEAFNMQYAIGGDKLEYSPTELAAAYAAFANGGYYMKPHMVRKVVMKESGTTISTNVEKTQIMSEAAAFMTSDLLYKAVNGKYKSYNLMGMVDFSSYPVYGKTGTTNWSDEEAALYGGAMKDEWTVNYTSEYTIATWTGFDEGVAGGNTNINDYLYMNVNTLINKAMLDVITKNAVKIAKPSGVSEYGGGYIKTEYLKDAAKINPKTEINTNTDSDPLQDLIDEASKYNQDDYTSESYQALLDAIKAAKKVLNNDDATQEEIDAAKTALQNAINALQKADAGVDMSELRALINDSQIYIDTTKYNTEKVKVLEAAISKGITVAANDKATQAEVDAAASAISAAVQDCVNNPVTTPPVITPPETGDEPTQDPETGNNTPVTP